MKISGINGFNPKINTLQNTTEKKSVNGFGKMLSSFVQDVNTEQINSVKLTEDFVAGENVELHEVMIASEKAKTSLELLMQIRNKTVDMYKELTRMQ